MDTFVLPCSNFVSSPRTTASHAKKIATKTIIKPMPLITEGCISPVGGIIRPAMNVAAATKERMIAIHACGVKDLIVLIIV